jgi:hypothetical protein
VRNNGKHNIKASKLAMRGFLVRIACLFAVFQQISAELTQKDLADIKEIVSEIVSESLRPLKSNVEKLSGDVEKLSGDVEKLTAMTKQGFQGVHNVGRDRVSIAKQFTNELKVSVFGCKGSLTRHAFIFNEYVGELITPHMNCDNATKEQIVERDALILLHPTKDLGVISQCPSKDAVLNISVSTIPQLGDNVVAFGFGDTANVWTGPISKLKPKQEDSLLKHWSGTLNTTITSGEYLVQSAQHPGMSGAAASNGCGYLGMAHAVEVAEFGSGSFAGIISAQNIQDFIRNLTTINKEALKRYDECFKSNGQPLDIVSFPIFPFMNCTPEESLMSSVAISILGF